MPGYTSQCRICTSISDESVVASALQEALPLFQWGEGDSSWDKIRVWGKSPEAAIRVFRRESPGPFELTIEANTQEASLVLRDQVVKALCATIWKPLEPQPVLLVKVEDRFPEAYDFECDREISEIGSTLDDADFWYWELLKAPNGILYLDGRVPFRIARLGRWTSETRVRITGETPHYTIGIGHWPDDDRDPTCNQVHETVQNTILPAIGARDVRASIISAHPAQHP